MKSAKVRVICFVAVTAALSAIVSFLDSRSKLGPVGTLVFMWTPALAALAVSAFTRRSFLAIGWRPRLKWVGLGWLLPVVYGFISYGLVWLSGLGGVPKPLFLERARDVVGLPHASNLMVIVAAFGFISVWLLPPSMISALGEELGWRGFLVPELTSWMGPARAAIFSGVIWCAWHLPGVLWFGYGSATTPKAYQVMCFSSMVITTAIIMAWLRLKSGSVWPSVVMHAVHNALIQMFFDSITVDKGLTGYFTGEFGIMLSVPLIAMAVYCFRDLRSSVTTEVAVPSATKSRDAALLAS